MTINKTAHAKGQYGRPELKVYGSVRNLTGGSQTEMNDGNGSQTLTVMA